jgi:hypothetical protein
MSKVMRSKSQFKELIISSLKIILGLALAFLMICLLLAWFVVVEGLAGKFLSVIFPENINLISTAAVLIGVIPSIMYALLIYYLYTHFKIFLVWQSIFSSLCSVVPVCYFLYWFAFLTDISSISKLIAQIELAIMFVVFALIIKKLYKLKIALQSHIN